MADDKKQIFLRLLNLTSRLMGSKGLTVRDLGGVDEATKRQIQRDLKRLRESEIPLETTEGQEQVPRYSIPNLRLAGSHLNLEETLAFTLLTQLPGNSEVGKLARQGWDKLHYAVQNGNERRHKADLPTFLSVQAGWNLSTQMLRSLSEALVNSRRLKIHYQGLADADPRWRLVEPWQLFFQDHWYLRAWDPATKMAKTFRTERILDCQLTDEQFHLPSSQRSSTPHFHRWDVADRPPTEVDCQVDESLARWLQENPVHPSQEINGTTFRVTVRDMEAFVRWTMSLTSCQILGPAEAKQFLQQRLRALLEKL
jgi:predicted DNA-binding transcriptional regulator YafY